MQNSVKDLGVMIDSALSFKGQTNKTENSGLSSEEYSFHLKIPGHGDYKNACSQLCN